MCQTMQQSPQRWQRQQGRERARKSPRGIPPWRSRGNFRGHGGLPGGILRKTAAWLNPLICAGMVGAKERRLERKLRQMTTSGSRASRSVSPPLRGKAKRRRGPRGTGSLRFDRGRPGSGPLLPRASTQTLRLRTAQRTIPSILSKTLRKTRTRMVRRSVGRCRPWWEIAPLRLRAVRLWTQQHRRSSNSANSSGSRGHWRTLWKREAKCAKPRRAHARLERILHGPPPPPPPQTIRARRLGQGLTRSRGALMWHSRRKTRIVRRTCLAGKREMRRI